MPLKKPRVHQDLAYFSLATWLFGEETKVAEYKRTENGSRLLLKTLKYANGNIYGYRQV